MTTTQIKDVLHRRPFEPFRVVTSAGDSVEVTDPENAMLVKGGLLVAYRTNPDEEFPDRWRTISLLHIVALDIAVKPGA